MTEQQKEEAIKYIESQLESGYIDLGIHDEHELRIIKETISLWKFADKWNSIPEEYFVSVEDWKKLGYTNEEAEDLVNASKIYT